MTKTKTLWRAGLVLAAGLATACGGDEAPSLNQGTTQAMGAPTNASPVPGIEEEIPGIPDAAIVGNRAPRLKGVQVQPAGGITAGSQVRVDAGFVDPDGDPIELEYTWWINDEEQDERSATLSTVGLKQGDMVRVQVIANDGRAESSPVISPALPVVNGMPRIVSTPTWDGSTGKLTYQIEAVDPEGDTDLRFALARGPAGMTVSEVTGLVEWLPTSTQMGVHPIELVVRDSSGARGVQTFELTLDPPAGPSPPAAAAR